MIASLLIGSLAAVSPCDDWKAIYGDPGLHCIELVPRPEFEAASGSVRLVPARSPFGIAVTRSIKVASPPGSGVARASS